MHHIIHITHHLGGGTQKYIYELCALFSSYKHVTYNRLPFDIDAITVQQTKLVHIHAATVGTNIGWTVLDIIAHFKQFNIPVYLTLHDYQWIFPDNPGITSEFIQSGKQPDPTNIANTIKLLDSTDKIIVPSQKLLDNYKTYLNYMPEHAAVVPHNDIPLRYQQLVVTPITGTINIAFVGYSALHKGILKLYDLANVFKQYYGTQVTYHLYGGPVVLQMDHVIGHGTYYDKQLIKNLHRDKIHLVLMLSLSEETYCYSLSRVINSGLPVVYFNRGSLLNRVPRDNPRFFPSNNNMFELQKQVVEAIQFIYKNQGKKDYIEMKEEPELNEWYENNYLV
jgi:glycosyltransferase involved in cell wall biosynthesis